MENENDPKPPPLPPPATLDYAGPEQQPKLPYALQVVLGFLAFFIVIAVTAVAAAGVGLPPSLAVLFALFVLFAGTGWIHNEKRWTGFAAGVLLGLGLSILAFGICFIVVMRSFG